MTGKNWIAVSGVAAIVVALMAVAQLVISRCTTPPQPPDFQVSANPGGGTVQAGGTVTTHITVEGVSGFQRQVRLSASGQPDGVLISLNPDKGTTDPKYVSTATITVGGDVPAGAYEIRIKATADNGDERVADFGLTVSRPQEDLEGIRVPEVKINKPMDGSTVNPDLEVAGVITGQIPSGWYMWVLLNPHPSPGQYWPQAAAIVPFGGEWRVRSHAGRPEDKGEKFDFWVYLVDSSLNEEYARWIKEGIATGSYPPLPAPATGKSHALAKTTVTLGE